MKRYENYHKHCHESNITTLDCVVKNTDYISRSLELGCKNYFTTQHGWTGKYLEAYDLCEKNNLKMIYAAELYMVKDRKEKDNSNYHVVIVAKNQDGFYELNEIMSESNKTGFYYKPRIDIELIKRLNPNNFIITSACVGGILRPSNDMKVMFETIYGHFNKNFYLEVQNHQYDIQTNHNKNMLLLKQHYGLKLIHANDSHYIYPEQSKDRLKFLKGKGMNYGDEDSFILDFPDYDTIVERYKKQGILSDWQIEEALQNTLIFDECEKLYFDKEIKMPTIYPGYTQEEKDKELAKHICSKWDNEKVNVDKSRWEEYKKGIAYEYKIIKDTKMSDYFLFNEKMVDLAKRKYGGVLSRTGRGSAVSFYINKLLGFTEIDRFAAPVPLYPTRFMSTARILETRSLPDIDQNWAQVDAPIKASKELLGDDGVYYMYALGTMKESSAFRNLCRAYEFPMHEYNEVAKNIDAYREDKKWKNIIEESQKYIGTIESISPSPCSFVLSNKPLSRELGLIKIGGELCACIDGYTSDVWKYLKNDYLTVTVWRIISNFYKRIKQPIPNIRELLNKIDENTWKLYEDGMTSTLNQADTEISTSMLKKYKPKTDAEMSAFVAAIRPGFASLVNTFLNRKKYTTGVKEIDEILAPSYHFMLYQESIMAFLVWCGMKEDHTYDIIKKISKKKFTDDAKEELRQELLHGYKKNLGTEKGFDEVWQVVDDAARYSFNASHAVSVAYDSLYGAEAKSHHPLEYFETVLNEYKSDNEKTSRIIAELDYFGITLEGIKFGKSKNEYTSDKETNTIYKSISSIKYCNEKIATELYELGSKNKYNTFVEVLDDIKKKTSVNSKQLTILTGLNFFSEFGGNKYLLNVIDIYEKFSKCKQISKKKLDSLGLTEFLMKKYSGKETASLYKDIDNVGLIEELCSHVENKKMGIIESMKFEKEYLEYIVYTNESVSPLYYMVTDFKTYKDTTKPYITARQIRTGKEIKTRIKQGRIFKEDPFGQWSVLKINDFAQEFKKRPNAEGKWEATDELEDILTEYEVIR
ncbi:PHP domain-containing protein [Mediterraneibacter gnavus]|jgi:DNA polymerase III alpha subunit|uniref:PHP domain-containing protein n=1 Tax=Mediterraneibacter gnavus TaxID=33038 RepID=UPI000E509B9F|nr:PHP domain-containing protein [Mediterraneibacter gnavus]RHE72344.1 PHP domain-containing protein [Mediterraneibacter gnavus]